MTDIVSRLTKLSALARENGVEEVARQADGQRERLAYDRVHLVVVGEFNRGKTTLVNALLGNPLLPMDIVPTTAAIWTIQTGKPTSAHVVMADGSKQALETSLQSLSRLSAEGALAREGVRFVSLDVAQLAVGDDVVVVDTPGVNDINEQRAEVTYSFLGQADAAIFMLDASSPVTKSEAKFLEGQLLSKSVERIVFVLNKIDRIEEDEVADSLAAAQERLTSLMGNPVRLVAFDAGRVLDGLVNGQLDAADHWGWGKLRAELDHMLAEARSLEARQLQAEKRAKALAALLEQRVASRLQLAQMKRAELEATRREFEAGLAESREAFARFIGFCEVQGRDRLKTMLSQSLRAKTDEFVEGTQIRIATMRGDFKAFAEKQLPYELQLVLKRWFEMNQPSIEEYLTVFSGQVSKEYAAHFGTTFGYVSPSRPTPALVAASAGTIVAEDANALVGMALPAVGYIAMSFLLAGPFALIGLVGGAFAKKLMEDNQAEEMRGQLTAQLPQFVEESIGKPFANLLAGVDQWFSGLTTALRDQFETDLARRAADLESAGKDDSSKVLQSLRSTQKALVDIAGH